MPLLVSFHWDVTMQNSKYISSLDNLGRHLFAYVTKVIGRFFSTCWHRQIYTEYMFWPMSCKVGKHFVCHVTNTSIAVLNTVQYFFDSQYLRCLFLPLAYQPPFLLTVRAIILHLNSDIPIVFSDND